MRDVITSGVKTAVQVAVSAAFVWAAPVLDWLAGVGVEVDRSAVEAVAFAVVTGLVTSVLNWAGRRWPVVNLVLSLGMTRGGPSYG